MNNLFSILKRKLFQIDWQEIETLQNPCDAYTSFLEQFLTLYDTFFPLRKIKIKAKDLQSPWITNGIKKFSNSKQRLYNKLLKNRNEDNEAEYENSNKLFEAIKKRSKKNHFSKLILTSPLRTILKRLGKSLKIQLAKVNVTIRIFLRKLLLII